MQLRRAGIGLQLVLMLPLQALAHFGRHYIPAEGGATPSGDQDTGPDGGDGPEETEVEGSLPSIAALRLSESSTANQGLVREG